MTQTVLSNAHLINFYVPTKDDIVNPLIVVSMNKFYNLVINVDKKIPDAYAIHGMMDSSVLGVG